MAAVGAPLCFLSYSRTDYCRRRVQLNQFVEDLTNALVETVAPNDDTTVLFRDTSEVDAGQQWDDRISAAVASTNFFIALLSPQYLKKRPLTCFCGKEFAAFRARANGNFETHLIPVLWSAQQYVLDRDVNVIKDGLNITFAADPDSGFNPHHVELYNQHGVLQLMEQRRSAYNTVVRVIADRVNGGRDNPPLPTAPPLRFGQLSCAFHPHCGEGLPRFDDAEVTDSPAGPQNVLAIVIAPDDEHEQYARAVTDSAGTNFASVTTAQAPIDGFDVAKLIEVLMSSTQKGQLPSLLIDGSALRGDQAAGVRTTLSSSDWKGRAYVIGDGGNVSPSASVAVTSVPGLDAITAALARGLIRQRGEVSKGQVESRKLTGAGPSTRPVI